LIHDSLPDLNLNEIRLDSVALGKIHATPFFIAGMTAGHPDAKVINERLARAAAARGWMMGLGSQRRELDTDFKDAPLISIRKNHPDLTLISNLGIAQVIELSESGKWNLLLDLLERSGASALAVHLNPLQEAIQMEGTPRFKNGAHALEQLLSRVKIPVILKETGSGMSRRFLARIASLPVAAVDVSGLGGTHWGRVEGMRADEASPSRRFGATFSNWGVPTAESILNAKVAFESRPIEIWASGGIRTGLDAAKCIALGANRVGFARPALEAALSGEKALEQWMESVESELRIALFCTNSAKVSELDFTKIERRNS